MVADVSKLHCASPLAGTTEEHSRGLPLHGASPSQFKGTQLRASYVADQVVVSIWEDCRKVDQLEAARRTVELFATDLSWARRPDALQVAAKFASTLRAFPELASEVDEQEIASRIRDMGKDGEAFYCSVLSVLLAPDDCDALEHVMLELARLRSFDLLRCLLAGYSSLRSTNIFLSRLIGEIDVSEDGGAEVGAVLGLIADKLEGSETLAKQRLGAAIAQSTVVDEGRIAEIEPLRLADVAMRARRHLHSRQFEPRSRVRYSADRNMLDVFQRARSRLAEFTKQNEPTASAQSWVETEPRCGRTGIIRWFDHQLSRGAASLDGRSFGTTYAQRTANGALNAREHPPGGIFQFGPWVSLNSGAYRLLLIGSADRGASFDLKITESCSANIICAESYTISRATTDSGVICEKRFQIDRNVDGVEFVVEVNPGSGALTIENNTIERVPLSLLKNF